MWGIDGGGVRIERERPGSVGKEEVSARGHPANPKNIKAEVESFLQQAMTIGVHKILEGEDEAQAAGDQEDGADEVGDLLRGAFPNDIECKDEGELEERQDSIGQPKNAEPVVFMVGSGDPDLADRGDPGDQIRFVPA